ncbi:transposase [Streptomyces sp. NPDC006539]|uniref:transposase n=1 Tax=Streptomyces sp. NPDC006539 TaxID=3155352 RepID=UPI0033A3388C
MEVISGKLSRTRWATWWASADLPMPLTEIKNRGVNDIVMLVCDGLKGRPDAVETVWPRTTVQTCVVHPAAELPLCRPPGLGQDRACPQARLHGSDRGAVQERFADFADAWGTRYPAIVRFWEKAWEDVVPPLRHRDPPHHRPGDDSRPGRCPAGTEERHRERQRPCSAVRSQVFPGRVRPPVDPGRPHARVTRDAGAPGPGSGGVRPSARLCGRRVISPRCAGVSGATS